MPQGEGVFQIWSTTYKIVNFNETINRGNTKIIIFALSQGEGHFGFEALYKIVIFL